jgi:ADP-heptose:LPS heptosyltransferase
LESFAKRQGRTLPLDYTDRDFVALSALGLERNGVPIELQVAEVAQSTVRAMLQEFHVQRIQERKKPLPILGVNIGCGTPDARYKRPDMEIFVESMVSLIRRHPHDLVLTGAPFEVDVNQDFMARFVKRWFELAPQERVPCIWDGAGRTNMPELCALIKTCDLFVSTDSGPYHMAVALRVPTFCWFVVDEPSSVHDEDWCDASINPSPLEFEAKTQGLLASSI